jgi:hypothetical protein
MKQQLQILFILLICVFTLVSVNLKDNNTVGNTDFVPDEKTAISVAEAIWLPIFGESIYNKKPFIAELKNNIWIVKGTFNLPKQNGDSIVFIKGGVPYIKIQKTDCKILSVYHTK